MGESRAAAISADVLDRLRADYLRDAPGGVRLRPARMVVVGDRVVVTFLGDDPGPVHVWTVGEARERTREVFEDLGSAIGALGLSGADAEALAAALS